MTVLCNRRLRSLRPSFCFRTWKDLAFWRRCVRLRRGTFLVWQCQPIAPRGSSICAFPIRSLIEVAGSFV